MGPSLRHQTHPQATTKSEPKSNFTKDPGVRPLLRPQITATAAMASNWLNSCGKYMKISWNIVESPESQPNPGASAVTSTVSGRQSRCFQVKATRRAGEGTVDSMPSKRVGVASCHRRKAVWRRQGQPFVEGFFGKYVILPYAHAFLSH